MRITFLFFVLLFFCCSVAWLFIRKQQYRNFLYQKEATQHLEILDRYRQSIEHLHMLQHDVQNHFLTIRTLAVHNERDKALEHIQAMRDLLQAERDNLGK